MSIQIAKNLKKITNTISRAGEDVEEMKILYITRDKKNSSSTIEMVCQFLIKNKNAFTIQSNNFSLDINPKEMKTMFTQKSVHEC